MSAQRLRDAAALLRERAEVATPGPWEISRNGALICAAHPQVASTYRVVAKADDAWIDVNQNAAYIATVAPPVALALADWLDFEAMVRDQYAEQKKRFPPGRIHAALTVADAILGGGA